MKLKHIIITSVLAFSLTSCMINTHTVGNGGTFNKEIRAKSIYIFGNRIAEVDSQAMAGGATDYTIDTRTNFVDMLVNTFTFGVFQTRTVIVKK